MKWMTINEAADILGISPQQLRRGIQYGRYPFMLVGNRKLVDVDELILIISEEHDLINIRDLSAITGLTTSAIRAGIADGWLPHRMIGRKIMFDLSAVEEAIRKRKQMM